MERIFYHHEIINLLKASKINAIILKFRPKYQTKAQYIVSLFDDDFYTQVDFDIIDGKTRKIVRECLINSNWNALGSRYFISPCNKTFFFAKPSHTLGCNPADKLNESLKEGEFIFATPTQAILLLLKHEYTVNLDEDWAIKFLHHHPVNTQKVYQWIAHDGLQKYIIGSEKKMKNICDEGNKLRKAKDLLPIYP